MKELLQWFGMNGYSMYIWPAYGLVGLILMLNLFSIKRLKQRTYTYLRQWFKTS